MVQLLELWSFEAVVAIAGIFGIQTQAGGASTSIRQQGADQIWGALKDAVGPRGRCSNGAWRWLSGTVGRAAAHAAAGGISTTRAIREAKPTLMTVNL
jgi:hypothetical protein